MTVKRRLNKESLYKLKPLLKPLLSENHRESRLNWAKANKNMDWLNVIFIDETTFSQFGKPKKVWRQKEEIIKVPTVKYSRKVYMYGCFSEKGFRNIYYFTENLTGDLLYTIYKNTLLPSAGIFFGEDNHS